MPQYLSPELLSELREVFDKYDVNHDEEISASEMRLIMFAVGQEPTDSDVYDQFRAVNCNGECNINFDQFLKTMAPRLRDIESDENLRLAFKVFDRQRKGSFRARDVRIVMAGQGEVISEEDSQLLVAQMDKHAVGRVTLSEFLDFMHAGGAG